MKNLLILLFTLCCYWLVAQHEPTQDKSIMYTIPVVFHVLHQDGFENISFAQIEDAVRILNENYSATNASVSSIHPDFQGMQADAKIEFKLAKIAPNGQCFNGVTRTYTPLAKMTGLLAQKVQAMINNNDVFNGNWLETQYLNIFVCWANDVEATSSDFTEESGMLHNSIFVLDDYVGSIGTSAVNVENFITTEVGRWLSLQYTFGPKTFGLDPNSCSTDDGLADTPNCVWNYACNFDDFTCGPRAMIENFMALSYCMKFFTNDQVGVMHATLDAPLNPRFSLWQTSNLIVTGVNNSTKLCKADFTNTNPIICHGKSVQFKDASYSNVQSWLWSFPGGVPATSTEQNPLVFYDTPGIHNVSLTVSNGVDTLSVTKNNLVNVTATEGMNYTYYEGFESVTNLDNNDKFFVYNPDQNAQFEITNAAAHLGNKSALLHNFNDTIMSLDALISTKIDISWLQASSTTFSFRYAFRRRANDSIVSFKLVRDHTCSNFWINVKDLTNDIKIFSVASEDWYPTSNDWQTIHITNLGFNSFTENFRYKFEFLGAGTNNLFIDDINIYEGAPSDDIVVGVDELSTQTISQIELFPNPNYAELKLSFDLIQNEELSIEMYDIRGNILQSYVIHGIQGSNLVFLETSFMSKGMYLVKVKSINSEQTLEFLKQ